MGKINCIFTVDVEEYFHAENILNSIPREKMATLESRVEIGTRKLLGLLAKYGSTATFFVLGCVAEKNPDLIKDIVKAGHEIASHGYQHIPIYKHTKQAFDEDLGKSIKILEDIARQKVAGYRATSFSFPDDVSWFFDTLIKHGIEYDSSLGYSLFRGHYSNFSEKLESCENSKNILEFPPSFISLGPFRFPLGGGYLRAYPYWLTRLGLGIAHSEIKKPPLFYMHPWELDPGQPRLKLPPMAHMRHYLNLKSTSKKLERLLSDFRFISINDFLRNQETPYSSR